MTETDKLKSDIKDLLVIVEWLASQKTPMGGPKAALERLRERFMEKV